MTKSKQKQCIQLSRRKKAPAARYHYRKLVYEAAAGLLEKFSCWTLGVWRLEFCLILLGVLTRSFKHRKEAPEAFCCSFKTSILLNSTNQPSTHDKHRRNLYIFFNFNHLYLIKNKWAYFILYISFLHNVKEKHIEWSIAQIEI